MICCNYSFVRMYIYKIFFLNKFFFSKLTLWNNKNMNIYVVCIEALLLRICLECELKSFKTLKLKIKIAFMY